MARAYFTCPCGEQVAIHGANRREADRKAAWMESRGAQCADCERKTRDAANAVAAEANAAAGLPPLTGTEKQVAWAESIRASVLQTIADARDGRRSPLELARCWGRDLDPDDPGLPAALAALQQQTAAAWWIDRRSTQVAALLIEVAQTAPVAPPLDAAALEASALAEATIRPEREVTATVAEIRLIGARIEVIFPEKRDDFRQLVRFELGYTWSGTAWTRTISDRAGPVAERAVELGNRLLSAGFPIRLQDADLRARAVAGDYAPERKRWVTRLIDGPVAGRLYISWPRDDDFYAAAKHLPGARYSKPGVSVPADAFDAIADFIAAHGFSVSAAAQSALDTARAAHDAAVIVTPARVRPTAPDGPGAMPPTTDEIDPELRDD
jgi:hypothetical protein